MGLGRTIRLALGLVWHGELLLTFALTGVLSQLGLGHAGAGPLARPFPSQLRAHELALLCCLARH